MILAIVPAYNEGKRIGGVVAGLRPHVDRVVVVDDGSRDETSVEASRAGATVLRHEINRGQGASLETGHSYARRIGAEVVIHFDGDDQFQAAEIPVALAFFREQNADILFGSRFLGNATHTVPFLKRHILLPLARLVDRAFGAPPLSDAHNGFRILSAKALSLVRLTQDRMAHASEIPRLVRRHQLRYVEHPVTVSYHSFGQGAVGGLRVVKDLFYGYFIS